MSQEEDRKALPTSALNCPRKRGNSIESLPELGAGCTYKSSSAAGSEIEEIQFTAGATGTYYLGVYGYSDSTYTIEVLESSPSTVTPEICLDGFDNDGDSLVDYDDPDCTSDKPEVAEPPAAICEDVNGNPAPIPTSTAPGLVFITHGWDSVVNDPHPWIETMKPAIAAQISSSLWNVFTCHWAGGKGSVIGEIDPETARFQAMALGPAVGQQIYLAGYDRIHFIAHSAGSWLVDGAAKAIYALDNTIQVHTTFLDAYTPIGKGAGLGGLGWRSTWAEHYVDDKLFGYGLAAAFFFGKDPTKSRLRESHNIAVTGFAGVPGGHSWPRKWYQHTVDDPYGVYAMGWGFLLSQERGAPLDHTAFSRGKVTSLNWPTALTQLNQPILRATEAVEWAVLEAAEGVQTVGNAVLDSIDNSMELLADWVWSQGPQVLASDIPSPAWAASVVDVETPPDVLMFDYEFVSGADGLLSVEFEGEQIFVAVQQYTEPGVHSESILLGKRRPPGAYSLAFRLDPGGTTLTDVRVWNVQFASLNPPWVPLFPAYPAILFLITIALMGGVGLVALRSFSSSGS